MQFRVKTTNTELPAEELGIHEGFLADVRYVPYAQRAEIRRKAFTRRNVEVNDEQAQQAFAVGFVRAIFAGKWRGLKLAMLEPDGIFKIPFEDDVMAKLREIAAGNGGEIPYQEGLAAALFRHALPDTFQNKIQAWLDERDAAIGAAAEHQGK